MRYKVWQGQPAEPFKNTLPDLVCHVSLWDRHLLRGTPIPALNCCLHHGRTMWGCLRESHQYRALFFAASREWIFSNQSGRMCSTHICTRSKRAESSFQSVNPNVPQRAHGFVSIQLAVPRVRPASRQRHVTGHERFLMYQITISDKLMRAGYSNSCLQCSAKHNSKDGKRKMSWLYILDVSSGRLFLLYLSTTTLSDYRKTPLSSAGLTTYGHCAPSPYI